MVVPSRHPVVDRAHVDPNAMAAALRWCRRMVRPVRSNDAITSPPRRLILFLIRISHFPTPLYNEAALRVLGAGQPRL